MKKVWTVCIILMLVSTLSPVSAQGGRSGITTDNVSQVVELIRLGRGSTEHAAFSPDGQTIAVAGTVGVWLYQASALNTETEPPLLDTQGIAEAVAFSPDGTRLVVTTEDGMQVWDVVSRTLSTSAELDRTCEALAFSPDGSLLAFNLGYDGITVWNVAAGAEQSRIDAAMQSNASVVFSPDGALIAGSTSDYKAHLWRVANSSEVAVLSGHTGYVYDLAFSPDGALLASASYDSTVRLWDAASGSEVIALAGSDEQPLDEAYSVAFSLDGTLVASGHADGQIALWNVASKTMQSVTGPQTGDIVDLVFSPDGSQLLSASSLHAVQLWDAASGSEIMSTVGHTNYISAVAFSPDSTRLVIADWDENVWLWDTASRQQLNFTAPVPNVTYTGLANDTMLAYAPDGSLLATTDGFDVILLDAASGSEVRRLTDCNGSLVNFAFSPDSTLLAVAASEGLCVFNVATGELSAFFASNDWLNGVVFSPDQTMIATAGKDYTARVCRTPLTGWFVRPAECPVYARSRTGPFLFQVEAINPVYPIKPRS